MADYIKTDWQDCSLPVLDAAKLNYIEAGIENAQPDMANLRGLAANRPASVATAAGRQYIETDSPYAIWRDNGAGWDLVGFAAAAEDEDIAFWDLTETLDDTTAYGLTWYGDRRTIVLDPDVYKVAILRGQYVDMHSDAGNAVDIPMMRALDFDATHNGTGTIQFELSGIFGTVGNYGTTSGAAHVQALRGSAINFGTVGADLTAIRGNLENIGPGAGAYTGVANIARSGYFRFYNQDQAQITQGYGLCTDIWNEDVGSVIGTLYGLYIAADNEGTVTTLDMIRLSPANTGILTNFAALYIEDANGLGAASNYAMYCEGGVSRLIQNMAAAPGAPLELVQDHTAGAVPCLTLDQDDISEGFIDLLGSDRGVIAGVTNSLASYRTELNGVVYRVALYADA
jgi:hypothetical protein